jgi:nucleoid-associated protein YgaU
LLAELAVVTAVPIALWLLAGDPIPRTWPSVAQVQTDWNGLRAQPVQGIDDLLPGLVDVVWILWACCALLTTLTLITTLIHVAVRILPRLTPTTALGTLAATAALTAPAGHIAAHAATSRPAPNPLPDDQHGRLHLTLTAATTTSTSSPTIHVVVPGDNLWDLAEHYYGDGEDWRVIYTANAHQPQPGGQLMTDSAAIQPGWRLTIPNRATTPPAPAARPATANTPAPPGATAPTPPATAPTPAHTPHTAPSPGTTPRTHHDRPVRPAPPHPPPRTDHPHTVGHDLPEHAGYLGITLIAATASAVTLLRTRNNRHHQRPDTDIPPLASHLAAVHAAAEQADTYGYAQHENPDELSPPLLRVHPGIPMLGTGVGLQREIPLESVLTSVGALILTGTGALDAARALTLGVLAAATARRLDADQEQRTVLIDRPLAEHLLGPTITPAAGWLEITPTPEAALVRYHRHPQPTARVTLIQHCDAALADEVRDAHARSPADLSAVLIGPPDATTAPGHHLVVDADGTIHIAAVGSTLAALTGTRAQTLTFEAAADLYHVLAATHPSESLKPGTTTSDLWEPVLNRDGTRHGDPQHPTPTETPSGPPSNASPGSADPDAEAGVGPVRTAKAGNGADDHSDEAPAPVEGTPLLLRVLGELDVLDPHGHPIPLPAGQAVALLTLLALHSDGLSGAQICQYEYTRNSGRRSERGALHTAIGRLRIPLRHALATTTSITSDVIVFDKKTGAYRLDPSAITTDLARATDLTRQAEHTDDPEERLLLLVNAADLYRGELAARLDATNRDWLSSARYETLTRAVALHLTIAERAAVARPEIAAEHLRHAAGLAPEDDETTTTVLHLCQRLHRPDLAREVYQRHAAVLRACHDTVGPEVEQLARDASRR